MKAIPDTKYQLKGYSWKIAELALNNNQSLTN